MNTTSFISNAHSDLAEQIIALEENALRRWCSGDPSGFLELSADEVAYFDPFLARRIDGLVYLTAYYEALTGSISAEKFELINPCVQVIGETAVLSFNFESGDCNEVPARWNCTEVYRYAAGRWQIIQTHWSPTGAGTCGG
jgi:hypothetical protein